MGFGFRRMACGAAVAVAAGFAAQAADNRPWEFIVAGRETDEYPPSVDFESEACPWRIDVSNAWATCERSQVQQCFGAWTLRVAYRATGADPSFRLSPPEPLAVDLSADMFSAWMWFDHFRHGRSARPTAGAARSRSRRNPSPPRRRPSANCSTQASSSSSCARATGRRSA